MKELVTKWFNIETKTDSRFTLLKGYPWIVIGLCAFFLFYKYLLQVSPSVMTRELMAEFDLGGVGLGNLAAVLFYTYLVTQLFAGPLLDKYSPRLLTALAIGLCSLGALIFSCSYSMFDVLLSRGLVGVGVAFATVSYLKLASIWFKPSQFAFVGGLLASAAMIGSLAGQAPLAFLVSSVGWRDSLLICSLFGITLAGLFLFIVRDDNPHQRLTKVGTTASSSLRWRDFAEVLKHKCNWSLMFYSGLAFSPVAVFGGLWGNPFLQEAYQLSREGAASLISMIFLGLAIGSPFLGYLTSRIAKTFEVMLFSLIISLSMLLLVLYYPLPEWGLGVALFIFGFSSSAFMLAFSLARSFNNPLLAATVVSLINTGDALIGSFSEPLVGKVLDTMWSGQIVLGAHYFSVYSYKCALGILPLYLAIAIFFVLGLRNRCRALDRNAS